MALQKANFEVNDMKRTYEKKPAQLVTSVKPTTLNLQTRGFATSQSESDEDVLSQSRGTSSENLLEKLISTPTSEPAAPIQRKTENRLKAVRIPIQAKLNIGEPNDKYEKEADDTASKVVQQINSSPQDQSVQRDEAMQSRDEELQMKSLLQRRENLGGGEASPDLESSIQSALGGGQSLDSSLQTKMGQAMGADFSSVKVHTDSQSDLLNQSIQAKAFTTGQDVFFRQGAYDPSSHGGQELIAHELTHVVQQNGNNVQTKPDAPTIQRVSVKERIAFFESLGVDKDKQDPSFYKNVSPDKAEEALTEEKGNKYDEYITLPKKEKEYTPYRDSSAPTNYQNQSSLEFSPDSGSVVSGVSDTISSFSPWNEEDEDNNYEAPKKYGKVNKRLGSYEGEDKDSRDITHVNQIFDALEDAVAQGKLASVAEGLKKSFGWSDEDVVKYYDNKEKSKVDYLDEDSRKDYELIGGSTLMQGEPPTPFDTSNMFSKHSGAGFGIYVMSPNGELYSHAHKVGLFHHSSFLAGLPTAGAGEIKVVGGTVQHVTNKSGHYQPDDQNMIQTLQEFKSRGVNLSSVKLTMVDGRKFDSAQEFLDDNGG